MANHLKLLCDGSSGLAGVSIVSTENFLKSSQLERTVGAACVEPPRAALEPADLEAAMEESSRSVRKWDSGSFTFVRKLQDAEGNQGHVDIMYSALHGKQVAVKQMPNSWVADGPGAFDEEHPRADEKPWHDLGTLWRLNRIGFSFACDLLGVFRDDATTFVVTSLATMGDLLEWQAKAAPEPGRAREAALVPIMKQVFSAVRHLHDLGVAHRDLSAENILLTLDANGETMVKIIDFAVSTLAQMCMGGPVGKTIYLAPEMYTQTAYDAFRADNFSLGVVTYVAALGQFPWTSTMSCSSNSSFFSGTCGLFARQPQASCKEFAHIRDSGLRKVLEHRKFSKNSTCTQVLSEPLLRVLEGLLDLCPQRRMCLGEAQIQASTDFECSVVWDCEWLAEVGGESFAQVAVEPLEPHRQLKGEMFKVGTRPRRRTRTLQTAQECAHPRSRRSLWFSICSSKWPASTRGFVIGTGTDGL